MDVTDFAKSPWDKMPLGRAPSVFGRSLFDVHSREPWFLCHVTPSLSEAGTKSAEVTLGKGDGDRVENEVGRRGETKKRRID